MELQVVSESELLLLRIIWAKDGAAMFADITDGLAVQGITMHNNTALTLLNRLIEKGFLKTRKIGRRNEYKAIVTQGEYNAAQTKNFVDKIYDGNVKDMVSTLINHGLVSEKDRAELRSLWKEGENGE